MSVSESSKSESIKDKAAQEFYAKLAEFPMLFGKVFFEKHFRLQSPEFHHGLMNAARDYQKFACAAPRGSAKSTLLSFVFSFHGILFKKFRFIVNLSNTFKKSAMHLDAIKKEIGDNQDILQFFKGIQITRDQEGDSIFHHSDGFETQFLCKGVDQLGSLRGVKFRSYRPDLVIIDDLEDDELVKNPGRRADLKDQFDEVLNQLGDRFTKFIVIGTILHDDSQLSKLLSPSMYLDFKKCILRAHLNVGTPQESSLWPEKWDLDYLKNLMRTEPNVYA